MPYRAHIERVHQHLRHRWRKVSVIGVAAIAVIFIIVQMVMPWDNLPLFAMVDGVQVGGKSASAVVKDLNGKYKKLSVDLYFGDSPKPYRQPSTEALGLSIDTKAQVDAKKYPFWLRLVPTSIFWAHFVSSDTAPTYKHDAKVVEAYVKKELGTSCKVTPQNASVEYKDKKLAVVPAIDGGTCELSDVEKSLTTVSPRLGNHSVRVTMDERPAKIHDDVAKKFVNKIMSQTTDVSIKAGDADVPVSQDVFLSWLVFAAPNSGITATVDSDKSKDFFAKQLAPKVSVRAGTTKVTTMDFTETSRSNGSNGRAIDTTATIKVLNEWLDGSDDPLVVKTKVVTPTTVYTRNYSPTDTGISALIAHFAESHPGSFGVSFVEITGSNHRRATYQDTKQFRTASTYKLFVAYSTIKRIEQGKWHWNDSITLAGGTKKTINDCMTVMIKISDNACGEALLSKIGFRPITDDIQKDIGLWHSSFMGQYIMTTAGDLTTFVGALYAGQLFNDPNNTNKLIGLMKQNVYRQGIPAGAKGTVADKVGFLPDPNDGIWYYNDAAIVYSPSGTYALSIMTKGSSWATIAELTRQIEALHAK